VEGLSNLRATPNLFDLTPDHERIAQVFRTRHVLHIVKLAPVNFLSIYSCGGSWRGGKPNQDVVVVVFDHETDSEEEDETYGCYLYDWEGEEVPYATRIEADARHGVQV
jgi:hypothetical protein